MSTIRPPYPNVQQRPTRRAQSPHGRPPAQTPRPYPYPAPIRARQAPLRSSSRWLLLAAAIANLFLVLLPVLLVVAVYSFFMLSGRVLPGVSVGALPAGSQTKAQLAQNFERAWAEQRMLVLTDGIRSWPITPGEAGLFIDAQATADSAYRLGRGPRGLADIVSLLQYGKITVEPVIRFDPLAAQAGLNRMAAHINQPAQNAALRVENGQWTAVAGQNGTNLQVEETLRLIALDPHGILEQGFVPLVIQPVAPRISDLTPVVDRLRQAVQQPLLVQAYDPVTDEFIRIPIPPETFAAWVTVEEQGDDYRFDIQAQHLSEYLNEWQPALGSERTLAPFSPPSDLAARWQSGLPVTLLVQHNPTSYTVQSGDTLTRIAFKVGMPYWKIQQANPQINPDQLRAGEVLVIPSKNEMLPLPVVMNKRIVISISQQRMWTYENGGQRSEHVISTGIDRSPTIPGIYQIQTHEIEAYASVWDLKMPHFMGIYEGWPGFMNGIHGLPTLSSGRRLWEGNLGRPVSYGCIILGLREAEELFQWAEAGVIVEIQP